MHDLNQFVSDVVQQPTWAPIVSANEFSNRNLMRPKDDVFIFERALSELGCLELIQQFDEQETYPVGVDGYNNSAENAGSFRAMGWSPKLAIAMQRVMKCLPKKLNNEAGYLYGATFETDSPFQDENNYEYNLLGSTPWLRFMRYPSGGMHVPHYDASFHQPDENYRTIFSWVLYLTDADPDQGGRFQFVDDSRMARGTDGAHAFTDWHRMADADEIQMSVRPQAGRLLVFPHWQCHQVEQFTGNDTNPVRCMIRGDVAYGY